MSCATCKHFEAKSDDHGYCEYPVPAWLILAMPRIDVTDKRLMPARYAPCACYEKSAPFLSGD